MRGPGWWNDSYGTALRRRGEPARGGVFTGRVSHAARREAARAARSRDIPLVQRHSCGLCNLRDCLRCLAWPGTRAEGGEAGAA